MSADNYNYVRKRPDGFWEAWSNLSASCERDGQLSDKRRREFATKEEAVAWADAQGYTEYGTEVDESPTPAAIQGRGER